MKLLPLLQAWAYQIESYPNKRRFRLPFEAQSQVNPHSQGIFQAHPQMPMAQPQATHAQLVVPRQTLLWPRHQPQTQASTSGEKASAQSTCGGGQTILSENYR